MTVAEILHQFGNNCAFLFRDLCNGDLNHPNIAEYKKQQALLRVTAEKQIRGTIEGEKK